VKQLYGPFRIVVATLACLWPIVLAAGLFLTDDGGQGQWLGGVAYAASVGLPVSFSNLTIFSVLLLAALNARKRFSTS